jgi:hypothetical protein
MDQHTESGWKHDPQPDREKCEMNFRNNLTTFSWQPRKYSNDQGADAVTLCGRQHGQARECECLFDSAWSKTLACRYALCTRTGRSPAWPPELLSERSASGRRGVEADEEQGGEVRPFHSSADVGEQTWATRGGVGGAKGRDRGKREQHTCRTQSRESVSQGLERVREVAKQDKKERFTSLLHHVSCRPSGFEMYGKA